MEKCEHYVYGDDENLLLDDENFNKEKKCVRCRKLVNTWNNGNIEGTIIWTRHVNETNHNESRQAVPLLFDDHGDNSEDSPLLINDCYMESADTDFHCHDSLSPSEDVNASKKLFMASVLCFLFMAAELIGGYFAGSLAVMTDAAHLFSDFIGFLISLLAIWIGKKPPTRSMTFGYHRAEVMGALLSVLTIWLLAAIFSTLSINRLYNGDYEIESDTMLIISSMGLVINIVMGGILHGMCHAHSHGAAAHGHAAAAPDNINVRAAAAHVLGDLLQSLGVFIAALVIKFYPDAKVADPICTLVFSVFVICTTLKVGKDAVWLLVEGSPLDSMEVMVELKRLGGVKHVHNLNVWSLAPGKDAVAVHLAVDQYCDRDLLLKKATKIIRSQMSVISCTVQVEVYNSDLINSCRQCQILP